MVHIAVHSHECCAVAVLRFNVMATLSGLRGGEEVGRNVCSVCLVVSGSPSHQLEKRF